MRRRIRSCALFTASGLIASFIAHAALAQPAQPAAPPAAQPPAPQPAQPPPPNAAQPGAPAAPAPPPPDLPPPPPPPWTSNPATGAAPDLTTPPPTPGAPAPGAPAPAAPPVIDHTQERRITQLEHELTALRAQTAAAAQPDPVLADKLAWLKMFKVSGYVQPQLLWQFFDANASPNVNAQGALPAGIGSNDVTARPPGSSTPTTNPDFFRLRRARLKTEFQPSDYARIVFEIDPTAAGGTVGGTGTIARQVEAQGIAHWTRDVTTEFAAGVFKIPFGFEVLQSDADRPFIERSWSEQNITPGEFDTGARAYTTFLEKKATFMAAVVNGQTQGESSFSLLPDPNKGKDLVGRINYNFGIVDVGASGMYGQGQTVDQAHLRFKQYPRWAGNGEVAVHHAFAPSVGQTRLFAEVTYAQNYDRGTKYGFGLPTIPDDVKADVTNINELGWWVRLEQDITGWVTLGVRYDFYTPNVDVGNDGRDTFSAVGVLHFTKGLQWMVEYDHATDNAHKATDVAPSKHIDTISNVLQARF